MMRLDRKAGLSTEKRNLLWSRYGRVLGIPYSQPRLSPQETPCEFLMLCMRPVRQGFRMSGSFYRLLFRNFVLTFNQSPEVDETYLQVLHDSQIIADEDYVDELPFPLPSRKRKKTAVV